MSVTVTVPEGYGYVGASIFLTTILLQGLNSTVSRYRKIAKIEYPQMYAEKAEMEKSREALLFNCAQRAHHNTLEFVNIVYVTALISGLRFPVPTALATTFWTLSRVSYTRGYMSGIPNKRNTIIYYLGEVALIGLFLSAGYISGGWVLPGLLKAIGRTLTLYFFLYYDGDFSCVKDEK